MPLKIISTIIIISLLFFLYFIMKSNVNIIGDVQRDNINDGQIRNIIQFSESIIKAYNDTLEKKKIPYIYRKEFLFHNSKFIAKAIVSSNRETVLNLLPSDKKIFDIRTTKYPAWLVFLIGKEDKEDEITSYIGASDLLSYSSIAPVINIRDPSMKLLFFKGGGGVQMGNIPFIENNAKYIVFMNDVVIYYAPTNAAFRRELKMHNLLLLSGKTTFNFNEEVVNDIVMNLIDNETQNLIVKSPFFKEALAHNQLKPIAENILFKKSRSEKDNFEYPTWEFQKDLKALKNNAELLGIGIGYVDALLGENQYKPKDGNFLFYYSNYFEFALQWLLVNLFMVLIIVCCLLFKEKLGDSTTIANVTNGAVFLAVNGYILVEQKPKEMPLSYALLPFTLILLGLLLTIYFEIMKSK